MPELRANAPGSAGPSLGPSLGRALLGSLALAALAAAWILTRAEPFALAGDNLTLTYAPLVEAARRIAAGELPLWSESRWGGSPLAGDPVLGALYPGHLFGFLATDFTHRSALDLDVAAHLLWLAAGMAWWLTGLGVRPLVAVAGLVLLVASPTAIVVARSWVQYWAAIAWWPWLFAAAARLPAARGGARAALGLAAALALAAQVYAGYPEFALHSGVAALAWLAAGGGEPRRGAGATAGARSRTGDLATALAVGVAAIAIAAPQILPGLAMARESVRSGDEGEAVRAMMRHLALTGAGWRWVLSNAPVNDFAPFRLAPPLLVAALAGAALGGARGVFLAAVAAASALLATGVLHGAFAALPVLAFFPAPAKLFYLLLFATVSLAALGLDRAGALPPGRQRVLAALAAASAVPACTALHPVLGAIAAALAVAALLAPAPRLAPGLLALVVAGSLATTAATDALRPKRFFGAGGFRTLLEQPLPERFRERVATRSLALEVAASDDVRQVGLDFASLFGQPSWNGIGPLAQSRQLAVLERIEPRAAAAVAGAIGASPVVVAAGGPLEGAFTGAGYDGPHQAGLRVLFAPSTPPRYALAPRVRFATREEAIAQARAGTAIAGGIPIVEREADGGSAAPPLEAEGDASGRVEVVAARPGLAELRVEVERPTWLLAREPYYPGWRATVDGAPVAIRPAAGFLLALPIPAGSHAVRLAYVEPGFARGAVAALVALIALPLALVLQERRGRK